MGDQEIKDTRNSENAMSEESRAKRVYRPRVSKAKPISVLDDSVNITNDISNTNEMLNAISEESVKDVDIIKPTKVVSLTDKLDSEESFEYNGNTWTPHKYNIGDIVWVPKQEVKNTSDLFLPIKVSVVRVPSKMTISSVVYTNHISYTFKETSKIIAAENYIFDTEEDCLNYCKGSK